jgi:hypothetical protein
MGNLNEFQIENGVLVKYTGAGGDVVIPEGVTSIGESAFSHCEGLTSVVIPKGVTSIGTKTFCACTRLTKVVIPDGVKTIGNSAFFWCFHLTSIVIPQGITSIKESTFRGCRELTNVVIPDGVTVIGKTAFENCKSLTEVVIPNGVTSIHAAAFRNCNRLTSVMIPESVASIRESAFHGCSSLTSVVIPEGVKSIDKSTFEGCESLTNAMIPESVTCIGKSAFNGCGSLTSVVIPAGVTCIENEAFSSCKSLTSVTIPEKVTSIGDKAFSYCSNLISVVLPEGMTDIGASAFRGCTALTSIMIPESVVNIGESAFRDCTKLADEDGYIIIQRCVYGYSGKTKTICIPEGVTRIGTSAFSECKTFTSVVIPESVTSVGVRAFSRCEKLTGVVIAEGVTSIGKSAFYGCKSLTSVEMPESVTSIGESAFEKCTSLAKVVIPEGVIAIGVSAFSDCQSLTSVAIPKSVTSIGEETFSNCTSLTSVLISEGVTSIDERAFFGCTGLTSVVIPESVTSIGNEAFCGCRELKAVDIEGSMTKFGTNIFRKCPHLTMKPEMYFTTQRLDVEWVDIAPRENIRVMAYIQLYQSGKAWTDVVDAAAKNHAAEIAEEISALLQNSKKASAKVGTNVAEYILKWRKNLQAEQIKKMYQLLQDQKCTKAVERLKSDVEIADLLKPGDNTAEEQPMHPVEQIVHANWKYTSQVEKLKKYVKKGIKYRGAQESCSSDAVIFVIAAYISQVPHQRKGIRVSSYKYGYFPFCAEPIADQVAVELDQEELLTLLENLTYEEKIGDCAVPLGRYADAQRTERLISQMQKWAKWTDYGLAGRQNIILARGALMLNDTRPALLHMDKVGQLEDYAKLRGTDADILRDTMLAEFGLDAQGQKSYDLGNTTVVARMAPDLTLSMYDTVAGKVVKSIPKKGAEPEKYEAAKTDFADLKKNIKKVVKARRELLFADFLSGRTREAGGWKRAYLINPVLNQVAQLLVWNQGEKTFTLKGQEPIGCDGQEYMLSEEPVGVAHPIMMTKEEQSAWQNYFTENHLKQPFEQVWEPQYSSEEIASDRYEGCQISVYRFMNQSKHGIDFFDEDFHNEIGFTLEGCSLQYERTSPYRHEIGSDETFTLGKLSLDSYTRTVNHIVFVLDKWTVTERILQDDVTIAPLLGSFTAAQISEFLRLASEKSCTNVTALLLEYQNEHFGQFAPMAEFTLSE